DEQHKSLRRSLAGALVEEPPQQDGEVKQVEEAPERRGDLRTRRVIRTDQRLVEDLLSAEAGGRAARTEDTVLGVTYEDRGQGDQRPPMRTQHLEARTERIDETFAPLCFWHTRRSGDVLS